MNDQDSKCRAGFTLIEVVIGLTVFMIVIASIFGVLYQSFQMYESARDTTRVAQILQYQVENMRAMPWEDLTKEVGTKTINVDSTGLPGAGSAGVPYDWQAFTFQQTITATQSSLYDAEWTATWTDRRGRVRSETFKTKFCEDALNEFYTRTTTSL